MMIWVGVGIGVGSKMREIVKICYKTTILTVNHFPGSSNCIHEWFYWCYRDVHVFPSICNI